MSILRCAIGLLLCGSTSAVNPLNFAFPENTAEPTPFQISVDAEFIQSTIEKARSYRPSFTPQNLPEWEEGAPPEAMNELARYWADEYDWADVQEEINSNFSHFTTTVTGSDKYPHPIPLHFIHERASQSNDTSEAIPLLMLHGWPSTSLEWAKVIHPLTRGHVSNASTPRFHVVAPDLPGYGFSPAATHMGLGIREMGRAFDALMHQLGYETYCIFSTDIGWGVGMWMAADSTSVTAHATDFWQARATADDQARFDRNETTAEETVYMRSTVALMNHHFGYFGVHATRPLSISLAMTDSPVGFLAWVWDLVYTFSDGYAYSKAELITTAMSLYIQGTYGNIVLYKDAATEGFNFPKTSVPTGILQFAHPNGPYAELKDYGLAPRDWTERTANVTFLRRHPFGGHFPAVSYPEVWVADVQDFFAQI
ncbi:Alpha/Beta hydrolase protein [Massariosphaeria phaeospora]|uniref:Alpha/Beta hydrolase protein n=1 Tax=Massariosphaeria phaeospora TaxID=100035 RepID=A0A7C8IDV3_9PLEO|nr:Alpha/Beta hydrolase protein [Massariosphaeria phaeospora]